MTHERALRGGTEIHQKLSCHPSRALSFPPRSEPAEAQALLFLVRTAATPGAPGVPQGQR